MVPFWTTPIAIVLGNAVILKPSEKVPLTMNRIAELFKEAGFPDGIFNMIQGTRDAVEAIIDHPKVKAVTFVGSSPVAELVANRCRAIGKRCTALGGAKNHLVALPDCETEGASSDITVSFAGCAGQRCMAASVLLVVGDQQELISKIVDNASKIQPGSEPKHMGPVIDEASYKKIISYIEDAENSGAKLLLDGRDWKEKHGSDGGNWIGPTIILHQSPNDKTMKEEVFGPVLSVHQVASWEEAIEIENENPFGNAASVYTTNGGSADWFTSRFRASMLGVNIGWVLEMRITFLLLVLLPLPCVSLNCPFLSLHFTTESQSPEKYVCLKCVGLMLIVSIPHLVWFASSPFPLEVYMALRVNTATWISLVTGPWSSLQIASKSPASGH
jgi:acyl-CoA reductase-like NAD-dependent aldehyde dehydrogenase